MQSPKRQISILIPYLLENDVIKIFLQKRSLAQKTLPGYFGFWGGGVENDETPELALQREIMEEMRIPIELSQVILFNRYEFLRSVKFVYLFPAELGWEQNIVVGEGDYGRWFTVQEALDLADFIFEDKVVVNDLERIFLEKSIR